MASIPVDFIAAKIGTLLENEITLLTGVRNELEEIKDELMSMKAFLQDADRKSNLTEVEKRWVANVRDKAYDVEDIIDEFMYYMNKQLPYHRQRDAMFVTRLVYRTIRMPKTLWTRHQVGVKLRGVKAGIIGVRERHQRYGGDLIQGDGGGADADYDYKWMRNFGESSLFFGIDDLVGIDDDRDLLVKWLLDAQVLHRAVISVFGMGGSGKTTLVASVYNFILKRVQNFDTFAWITVSQSFVMEELLQTMVKELFKSTMEPVPLNLSDMSYRELVDTLVNHLTPKRYVVVLDDVWNVNLWTQIKVALPDTMNGSRVLLTTRSEEIATLPYGVGSQFYRIPPMGQRESWALFCMKAFSLNPDKHCPPHLEKIAQDLVLKCEGLPLAIVTLGGVMSSKKALSEWKEVYSSLNWELNNNPNLEVVKSILWLSFTNLPFRLKPCFLYCCAFPEDCLIERVRLVRLWIAEGFVERDRGVTLEVIADRYLKDLICRSMIQVIEWDINGKPKVCKMHDLMRELALSTSERDNFFVAYYSQDDRVVGRARRFSIQANYSSFAASSQIRSFICFSTLGKVQSPTKLFPSGFKLLRVLDLENAPINTLPKEIVKLFNLRYLNLKNTQIEQLPNAIGRLHNLQTLDISETRIRVLPNNIAKCENLRHLTMHRYNNPGFNFEFNIGSGTQMPPNISKLKNLQFLGGVVAVGDLLSHLANLTQLTCLGITELHESDEAELCSAVQKLNLLEDLFVMGTNENENLSMNAISSPPSNLMVLTINGKMEKLPNWFHSLQSLTYLNLRWCRLTENFVPYLKALPNLVTLFLVNTYVGNNLCFGPGFDKLMHLEISNFPNLNEISFENGTMPRLERLVICCCSELKAPPLGVKYLGALQQMNLVSGSKELVQGIREEQKTWNIPKITNNFHSSSGYYYELLS